MTKHIIIICEGDSEVAYIKQLQSFLDKEAAGIRQLVFVPKNAASGHFTSICKMLKEIRKKNRNHKNVQIWVDYDLYHPQRPKNKRQNYLDRPQGVPAFHFSFHNFEDFLILHYPLDTVRKWVSVFENTGHFTQPLHHETYKPHFSTIFPDYRKGLLPVQFVNAVTLGHLKRNLLGRIIPPSDEPDFQDFAKLLLSELEAAYPEWHRGLI